MSVVVCCSQLLVRGAWCVVLGLLHPPRGSAVAATSGHCGLAGTGAVGTTLIAVVERIAEIVLRRALGAGAMHITWQF